jgi:hypothetical protein
MLKNMLLLLLVLAGGYFGLFNGETPPNSPLAASRSSTQPVKTPQASSSGLGLIEKAYADRRSDQQVQVEGRVEKLLPDDRDGSRHQRFIVRLDSGLTLLVAHNIDLAPRVRDLTVDDRVELYGEYEWNERGGVIHWTHRDPRGSHPDGWIRHQGRLYQ